MKHASKYSIINTFEKRRFPVSSHSDLLIVLEAAAITSTVTIAAGITGTTGSLVVLQLLSS